MLVTSCPKWHSHTHVENQIDLFLEHVGRQAEGGNLCAHHAAAERVLLEQVDLIAVGQQVAATASEAGPAPSSATRLPFLRAGTRGR
jgi:hypothetical protein